MSLTRRYGSVSKARAAIRSGRGSNSPLRRIKPDETLKVRFLQQPDDWEEGYYHYLDGNFQWCSRKKTCEGCVGGDRPKKVVLANALDVKEGKVIVVQMTTTLADSVLKRYEKFGETVMDRDYDLTREGSGLTDTKYSADYDPPKRRDLTRYDLHDIEALILSELGEEPDAEPEDAEPRSSKKSSRRTRIEEDEDEDEEDEEEDFEDEEEDDEEEDEEDEDLSELDRSELKSLIKELDPDFRVMKSHTDDALRSVVRNLRNAAELDDEEEDDEEEPPPPKKKKKSSAPVHDDEDEYRPAKKSAPAKKRVIRRPN